MTVEWRVPRPRAGSEDTGRSGAARSGAVADLHALVAELEMATRAVRTLGSVVAALDAVPVRDTVERGSPR